MRPHRPPSSASKVFFSIFFFSSPFPSWHRLSIVGALAAGCAAKSLLLLLSSKNTGPHVSSPQPLTYTQIIHKYSLYIRQTDERSGCFNALEALDYTAGCLWTITSCLLVFLLHSFQHKCKLNRLSPHVHEIKILKVCATQVKMQA